MAFFIAMWNFVVYVAAAGEGDFDFSDAGTALAQQNQEKKSGKLMQRQKKLNPKHSKLFVRLPFRTYPSRYERT